MSVLSSFAINSNLAIVDRHLSANKLDDDTTFGPLNVPYFHYESGRIFGERIVNKTHESVLD